jgi:hypothetical protein
VKPALGKKLDFCAVHNILPALHNAAREKAASTAQGQLARDCVNDPDL